MSRAYIRLDPGFDERKYEYPDGPYAALVACLCLAELQPERGRFRSVEYLARLLGKRGRHVRFLVDKGDLVILADERAYVDGWDEWQEGDWKVAERVGRIRARSRRTAVTADVTVPVTVGVTPDRLDSGAVHSGAERSGAVQDGRNDIEAFLLVTRKAPTPKQRKVLNDYVDTFDISGPERAARIILTNQADPIGALLTDLDAHRAKRVAAMAADMEAAESEKKERHAKKRTGGGRASTKELLEAWAVEVKRGAA